MSEVTSRTPETRASRYNPCPRCHQYCWDNSCSCKRFEVAIPDRDQVNSWRSIYAKDAEEAAERYAERYDHESAEYRIVGGLEMEIWVRDDSDEISKWEISGEAVPTYHAYRK